MWVDAHASVMLASIYTVIVYNVHYYKSVYMPRCAKNFKENYYGSSKCSANPEWMWVTYSLLDRIPGIPGPDNASN